MGVNQGLTHSEVDALRSFRFLYPEKQEGQKFFLINIRMSLFGFFGISRPCRHCALFVLRHTNLLDIMFYTDEQGKWQEMDLSTCHIHMFDHISFGHKIVEERRRLTHTTSNQKKNKNRKSIHHPTNKPIPLRL